MQAPIRRFLPHALSVLALAAAPASAQSYSDVPVFAERPDSNEALMVLGDRDRAAIHPGDPLRISGVMEGDNDVRTGLHALGRGEYKPVLVDADEAYERQLAMLETGARYDSSSAAAYRGGSQGPEIVRPGTGPNPAGEAGHGEGSEQPEPRSTTWIGLSLATLATIVYFVTSIRNPGLK